ncbi:MAG TPA: FGGY-family carbohydrate kinase [Acidimicrobiia bacterium]
MSDSILVVDVGTSGVRSAVVRPDATVQHRHHRELLPHSPAPGLVEFDAAAMAVAALDVARATLDNAGVVGGVAVTNQRASTIVWDRVTGEPVGPGVGWQDLRTVGTCLELGAQGIRVAPNASATKAAFLLDLADPDRDRDMCVGTVDTWIAWHLAGGELHVTDPTNAGVTGLVDRDVASWGGPGLEVLGIPISTLPALVETSGICGQASALPGAPPIAALVGDQQASLVGQGGTRRGAAKITFGTGAMLDLHVGPQRPAFETRGGAGTFPLVCWRVDGVTAWGVEATMLSAGTNVEWLRDGLGLIATAAESHDVAASIPDSGGVTYVPALLGLGAPHWDFGARGTLLGVTRGTGRGEVVRAVLEGVAHRGADLVDAAEADSGWVIDAVRVDGGMTGNPTFVQALADAVQRPVEVSAEREATTLGAGLLGGLAIGTWSSVDDLAEVCRPARLVEPGGPTDRQRWARAIERAMGWDEGLSSIQF